MSYLVSHRLSVLLSPSLALSLSLSACMVLTVKVGGQISTRYKMKVTYLPVPTYILCMYIHNYICCTKPSGILFFAYNYPNVVVLSFAGGGVVGWMSGLVMGEFMFWGWGGEDYDYTSGVIKQLAGCDLHTQEERHYLCEMVVVRELPRKPPYLVCTYVRM